MIERAKHMDTDEYEREYSKIDGYLIAKTPIVNGVRHGIRKEYGKKGGHVTYTVLYINGEKHGIGQAFKNQSTTYEEYYIHGFEVPEEEWKWYEEASRLVQPGDVVCTDKLYIDGGTSRLTLSYLNGKRHGEFARYKLYNGREEKVDESNYNHGLLHGKCTGYDNDISFYIHGKSTTEDDWIRHNLIIELSDLDNKEYV